VKRIKIFLLINLVFIAGGIWLWLGKQNLIPKPFCPFHQLTGIPCPGCGGTRAALEIIDGHFENAFHINPLAPFVILFFLILIISAWIDLLFKTNIVRVVMFKRWPRYIIIPVVGLVIIVWMRNIYMGV
jgi:hypothetical protein